MSISCVLIVQEIKCHVKIHRVKQLFRYEFLSKEDIMANPFKTLVLTDCLGMYDWALANKFFLTKGVSLDSHSGLSVKCVLTGNPLLRPHPQVYRYFFRTYSSLRFLTFLWECKQKFRLNLRCQLELLLGPDMGITVYFVAHHDLLFVFSFYINCYSAAKRIDAPYTCSECSHVISGILFIATHTCLSICSCVISAMIF